jgi:hypothetical protein
MLEIEEHACSRDPVVSLSPFDSIVIIEPHRPLRSWESVVLQQVFLTPRAMTDSICLSNVSVSDP